MTSSSRPREEKKRHKSRKPRRAHSSDSEGELLGDEEEYEPTSPAQWSSHHRHSTTSSINGRLYDATPSSGTQLTATQALRRRSPIETLPPEMLIHIFRQLTDVSHMHACLFVCSTWCQCVVELLWLKPHLASPASLLSFLSVINPGFNPHTEVLQESQELDVLDVNGEQTFDSREVLVNGEVLRDGKYKVQRLGEVAAIQSAAISTATAGPAAEPLFPYTRFVRRLNLAGVTEDIHDVHFVCLSACVRLERLTLNGCIHLTDASLSRVISALPHLVALDLTGVQEVTDTTILIVARTSSRLQGINLEGCKKITDGSIYAIAENCPLLRRIKLCDLDLITGPSVSNLVQSCPLLIEIDLNSCVRVGEEAARDIWSHCHHLRELRLAQCALVGDSAFPVPPKVAAASTTPNGTNGSQHTTVDQNIMSRVILPVLPPLLLSRPLVHLRQLDLMALQITDDAVAGIVINAPKLRNLVLAKCSLLTDRAVRSIAGLGRHLQFLHLGHAAAITDASIVHLARTCVRLRYVDLACCTSLTNESVRALAALPKLRRIGLVRVMNLTDQAVEYLTARQNTLERVHLSYCEQITVKAIYMLLQRLDKLTHLSLTGVPAFRKRDLQKFCRHPPSNFNELQRAAFCVYSGAGIHNLRKYLASISPNLNEYSLGVDADDGASTPAAVPPGHGMSSFGDPQLSDTDEEGEGGDISAHFHQPQNSAYPRPVGPNGGGHQVNGVSHADIRGSPSQPHSLHSISRSQATPGTSRQGQGSRTQRNGSSTSANANPTASGTTRQTLAQVPEAYAGIATSSSQGGPSVTDTSGSAIGEPGMRHRNLNAGGPSNMGGSLANPVVGALMHSRLQRSVAREEQGSGAGGQSGDLNPNPNAVATGSDGRRGFQRWMGVPSGTTWTTNGRPRLSAPLGGIESGGVSRTSEQAEATSTARPSRALGGGPVITPSSSTSASAEVRGVYAVADTSLTSESSDGHADMDEEQEGNGKGVKLSRAENGISTAKGDSSAAACVYHDNASGRSTPVGAEGTSRKVRKEKGREKASTPQPSFTVAPALDDLSEPQTLQERSRTSTPSPSPSPRGVRKKIKGFNAAAASLFKGKERKG